jgi:hypothetical protein
MLLLMVSQSVSQSVLVSSTHLGPKTKFLSLTVAGLLMWGTLSNKRTGLLFIIAAGPHQRSHSQVRVLRVSRPILLSQTRDCPNLEGQVLVFISPRNRAAQLKPQVLDSLFVAFYDSQDTVEVFEPASTRGTDSR